MNSKTTYKFRQLLFELPKEAQILALKNYELWKENHNHTSLNFKKITDVNPNDAIYSVRIGLHWRALGVYHKETHTIIWYWIGSHSEYNHIL